MSMPFTSTLLWISLLAGASLLSVSAMLSSDAEEVSEWSDFHPLLQVALGDDDIQMQQDVQAMLLDPESNDLDVNMRLPKILNDEFDLSDHEGMTALHLLAFTMNNPLNADVAHLFPFADSLLRHPRLQIDVLVSNDLSKYSDQNVLHLAIELNNDELCEKILLALEPKPVQVIEQVINGFDGNGMAPIHMAIKNPNASVVKEMMKFPVFDPNLQVQRPKLQELDAEESMILGCTALHLASVMLTGPNLDSVRELLKSPKTDLNARCSSENPYFGEATPLDAAKIHHQEDMYNLLLESGSSARSPASLFMDELHPLLAAAINSGSSDDIHEAVRQAVITSLRSDPDYDVNIRFPKYPDGMADGFALLEGMTALHILMTTATPRVQSSGPLVDALLQHPKLQIDARVSKEENSVFAGQNALHFAMKKSNGVMGEKLLFTLRSKPDAVIDNVLNGFDSMLAFAPIHVALQDNFDYSAGRNAILSEMLEFPLFNPNLRIPRLQHYETPLSDQEAFIGCTALHLACYYDSDVRFIRKLLHDPRTDINARCLLENPDFGDMTPLHFAARMRNDALHNLFVHWEPSTPGQSSADIYALDRYRFRPEDYQYSVYFDSSSNRAIHDRVKWGVWELDMKGEVDLNGDAAVDAFLLAMEKASDEDLRRPVVVYGTMGQDAGAVVAELLEAVSKRVFAYTKGGVLDDFAFREADEDLFVPSPHSWDFLHGLEGSDDEDRRTSIEQRMRQIGRVLGIFLNTLRRKEIQRLSLGVPLDPIVLKKLIDPKAPISASLAASTSMFTSVMTSYAKEWSPSPADYREMEDVDPQRWPLITFHSKQKFEDRNLTLTEANVLMVWSDYVQELSESLSNAEVSPAFKWMLEEFQNTIPLNQSHHGFTSEFVQGFLVSATDFSVEQLMSKIELQGQGPSREMVEEALLKLSIDERKTFVKACTGVSGLSNASGSTGKIVIVWKESIPATVTLGDGSTMTFDSQMSIHACFNTVDLVPVTEPSDLVHLFKAVAANGKNSFSNA